MRTLSLLGLIVLVLAPSVEANSNTPAGVRAPVGTGLESLDFWSTDLPFVDAFKMSAPWFSGTNETWEDQRSLDLDKNGWVRSLKKGQIAKTLLFWDISPHYLAGKYIVQYEGEGTLDYYFEFEGVRVEKSGGRDVVEVPSPPKGGIGIFIRSVNPTNYIRNIRVIMPVKAAPDQIFNPLFLERLRNYKAIRFTSWMLGSNPEFSAKVPHTWQDRPKREDARWGGSRGAPVEIMVALANQLGAHPWFTIPHLADDEYVRGFAEIVRQSLAPKLKAYVEHSNEVWNEIYPQNAYATKKGVALKLHRDSAKAAMRYHARRSREIFAIFENALGRNRLFRVLATQTERPEFSEILLKSGDIDPKQVDALAIAPYFGYELGVSQNAGRVENMQLDDLFRELETKELPAALEYTRKQFAIAREFGLPVVAYEGGQHLVDARGLSGDEFEENKKLNDLFDAANRDPRMGVLYWRWLEGWNRITQGQLFVHLMNCGGDSKSGRWGALEYLDQPRKDAPKYDALQRWMERAK